MNKDNPLAFPGPGGNGMSLRDWFAGQILAVIAADLAQDRNGHTPADLPWLTARACYLYADAMLAERAKVQP